MHAVSPFFVNFQEQSLRSLVSRTVPGALTMIGFAIRQSDAAVSSSERSLAASPSQSSDFVGRGCHVKELPALHFSGAFGASPRTSPVRQP